MTRKTQDSGQRRKTTETNNSKLFLVVTLPQKILKFGTGEECPWRGVTPRSYPRGARGGIRGSRPRAPPAHQSTSAPSAADPRRQRRERSRNLTTCEPTLGQSIARRRRVGERRREHSGIWWHARHQQGEHRCARTCFRCPSHHEQPFEREKQTARLLGVATRAARGPSRWKLRRRLQATWVCDHLEYLLSLRPGLAPTCAH